ncbi:YceI family protein [Xylanimonas cellulosilytica DSM 15894]|uniref:YceI family protein n=1 Tax=Xylanimonas cellulosilytica (strain DSM 15894 / JCM 12276 / CECT 5975 / KCTC 9989 / LMG 20990 / NBRC 107835 / XIL07) TaxID=446471 RepID=D1BZR1_XYLCX|nr:YceI family protein [Xylanimonas cellulosilytica]ACZ32039.1 YceI family protein [Xylanimonas cellulosilytica DSM 15894]
MTDLPVRTWNDLVVPAPGPYHLDTEHMRLGFQATHMMVSAVRGEFTEGSANVWVAEDPLESWASATLAAASIDTDNAERDGHLRSADFLDAANFPAISFRSTGISWQPQPDPIFSWARLKGRSTGSAGVPAAATAAVTRFELHGDLTIRDVTRPVTLDVEYGGARRDLFGRDIFGFSATTHVDREEYGLLWNVALEAGGVLVAKTVRLELAGEFIRSDGITTRS